MVGARGPPIQLPLFSRLDAVASRAQGVPIAMWGDQLDGCPAGCKWTKSGKKTTVGMRIIPGDAGFSTVLDVNGLLLLGCVFSGVFFRVKHHGKIHHLGD